MRNSMKLPRPYWEVIRAIMMGLAVNASILLVLLSIDGGAVLGWQIAWTVTGVYVASALGAVLGAAVGGFVGLFVAAMASTGFQ
jgi:hypothetical protein